MSSALTLTIIRKNVCKKKTKDWLLPVKSSKEFLRAVIILYKDCKVSRLAEDVDEA